jgi:uncharacterized repeat protein (TIGR03803 family)
MANASSAQTFNQLATFSNNASQLSSLVQGADGNLYGTSAVGGETGYGTVFQVTPSGILTTLHHFCAQPNCTDGQTPAHALVLATDGNLYGTTYYGGASNLGTIFRMTMSGKYAVVHSFNGSDGNYPYALMEATDGFLYGTASPTSASGGTVFRATLNGSVTRIYTFCQSTCADGDLPQGIIEGSDGNLYGTTAEGGMYACYGGCGTVFKLTKAGVLTTLHSFDMKHGAEPFDTVVQTANGSLFGTTFFGHTLYTGGYGTIFVSSTTGVFKEVYDFDFPNGNPTSGLTLASDGNLYGGTYGNESGGYIYELVQHPQVTYQTVYTWYQCCGGGTVPFQATDGKFYGTYYIADGYGGAIYSLDTGLSPFVTFILPGAKVGKLAQILGTGLTGTTSVTFNGVAATKFSVVSDTYMTAVVPAGATTGAVVVATPAGNLTSNVSFRVSK